MDIKLSDIPTHKSVLISLHKQALLKEREDKIGYKNKGRPVSLSLGGGSLCFYFYKGQR